MVFTMIKLEGLPEGKTKSRKNERKEAIMTDLEKKIWVVVLSEGIIVNNNWMISNSYVDKDEELEINFLSSLGTQEVNWDIMVAVKEQLFTNWNGGEEYETRLYGKVKFTNGDMFKIVYIPYSYLAFAKFINNVHLEDW